MTNKYLFELLELIDKRGYDSIAFFNESGDIRGISIGTFDYIEDIEMLLIKYENPTFH